MFAGHFGLAASIRALDTGVPRRGQPDGAAAPSPARDSVPLWALMLATQLLDVVFAVLLLAGVESYGGATGYGQGWIHAYYSHSLLGAALIALVAGLASGRFWGRRGGLIAGATVFSHWLLDLLVHRPDLPLLPGNLGNLPMLGFGLWNMPAISISLEALLVAAGGALYAVSVWRRGQGGAAEAAQPGARGRAWLAGGVMSVLLVLSLVSSVLGIA